MGNVSSCCEQDTAGEEEVNAQYSTYGTQGWKESERLRLVPCILLTVDQQQLSATICYNSKIDAITLRSSDQGNGNLNGPARSRNIPTDQIMKVLHTTEQLKKVDGAIPAINTTIGIQTDCKKCIPVIFNLESDKDFFVNSLRGYHPLLVEV